MSLVSLKPLCSDVAQGHALPLKARDAPDASQQAARLRKASREFESLIVYYMIKSMRQTVPKGDPAAGALSGGLGRDTFTEMFDSELARRMVLGGRGSIADALYHQLERKLTPKAALQRTQPPNELPALPQGKLIELRGQHLNTSSCGGQRVTLQSPESTPPPVAQTVHKNSDCPEKPSHVRGDVGRDITTPKSRYPVGPRTDAAAKRVQLGPDAEPPRQAEPTRPALSARADQILSRYHRYIEQAAGEVKLDSALVYSVIRVESGGDALAVSPKGAKGLMQLTDPVARQYGVASVFDPQENISGGARYLRDLIDRFGDLKLALAAYNAGPGNVNKYGGIPPFQETQNYVRKVMEGLPSAAAACAALTPKGWLRTTDK